MTRFKYRVSSFWKRESFLTTLILAGNLVLHSCNLWIGKPREGSSSSSGLHHDFHDNFYLLKHGVKQFRLFSPDCASCMYLHGEIDRIHSNGLISYVGSETRADGVPLDALVTLEGEDGRVANIQVTIMRMEKMKRRTQFSLERVLKAIVTQKAHFISKQVVMISMRSWQKIKT